MSHWENPALSYNHSTEKDMLSSWTQKSQRNLIMDLSWLRLHCCKSQPVASFVNKNLLWWVLWLGKVKKQVFHFLKGPQSPRYLDSTSSKLIWSLFSSSTSTSLTRPIHAKSSLRGSLDSSSEGSGLASFQVTPWRPTLSNKRNAAKRNGLPGGEWS